MAGAYEQGTSPHHAPVLTGHGGPGGHRRPCVSAKITAGCSAPRAAWHMMSMCGRRLSIFPAGLRVSRQLESATKHRRLLRRRRFYRAHPHRTPRRGSGAAPAHRPCMHISVHARSGDPTASDLKLTTSAARRSSSRWTSSVNPIRFPVWKPRSDEDDRLFGRTGPSRWGRSDARAGCRGPESIAIAPRRGPATTTSAPAGCRSSFLQ